MLNAKIYDLQCAINLKFLMFNVILSKISFFDTFPNHVGKPLEEKARKTRKTVKVQIKCVPRAYELVF